MCLCEENRVVAGWWTVDAYDGGGISSGGWLPVAGKVGLSSVGYTRGEGSKPRLWNLQNLCPVPP